MVNKYKNVERDMSFSFRASQPGATTRVYMTDEELEGIDTRWENSDVIAVFDFGEVFTGTNGGDGKNALALKYEEANDDNPSDGIDFATFKGSARAEMGENPVNSMDFALMYPYSRYQNMPCSSTSLQMKFSEQDGTLDRLRKEYMYAWGYAIGVCEDAEVELSEGQGGCSSELKWHSHSANGEMIIMDNKMSVIRFSMIAGNVNTEGDTIWETLQDYLSKQNLEVSSIEIDNKDIAAPGLTIAEVSLKSGLVTSNTEADPVLKLVSSSDRGLKFKEISEANATPTTIGGSDRVAWGSTFYLAVPCPNNKILTYQPYLTIYTRSSVDHKTVTDCPVFVGALERKMIKEGNYYMTAPIRVIDNKLQLVEDTKIYLYHHSSYVWTDDDAIDVY